MKKKTILLLAIPVIIIINFIFYLYFFGLKTLVEDLGDQKRVSYFQGDTLVRRVFFNAQNKILREIEFRNKESFSKHYYHLSGKKLYTEKNENNVVVEILCYDFQENLWAEIHNPRNARLLFNSEGYLTQVAEMNPLTGDTLEIRSIPKFRNPEVSPPQKQLKKPAQSDQVELDE